MLAIANRAGRALPLRKAGSLVWEFPAIPHGADVRDFDLLVVEERVGYRQWAGRALPLRKAVALGWVLFRDSARH